MPDALMYDESMYVVLETDQPEQFLTTDELRERLQSLLAQRQADLPLDLQNLPTPAAQAQRLIDTTCELDLGPNQFLQWYAVRLEK